MKPFKFFLNLTTIAFLLLLSTTTYANGGDRTYCFSDSQVNLKDNAKFIFKSGSTRIAEITIEKTENSAEEIANKIATESNGKSFPSGSGKTTTISVKVEECTRCIRVKMTGNTRRVKVGLHVDLGDGNGEQPVPEGKGNALTIDEGDTNNGDEPTKIWCQRKPASSESDELQLPQQCQINPSTNECDICPKLAVSIAYFDAYYSNNTDKLGTIINWITGTEIDNSGFRIWNGTVKNSKLIDIIALGGKENSFNEGISEGTLTKLSVNNTERVKNCYPNIECLKEKLEETEVLCPESQEDNFCSEIIYARGSKTKPTAYFYNYINDSTNDNKDATYYLLESIDTDGKREFHWDKIFSLSNSD